MSAGTVIEVQARERRSDVVCVEVLDGADLQSRYDQLLALALRMGSWLTGPQAHRLPRAEWERQFDRYQEHLEQLRHLGDQLRPITLRERREVLAGDALAGEVMELFAA
jgi:hypothetical protein